ncbi:MAG: metallophosphoesterase [Erysipelotrichaceae bacterium]
MIYICSDLHGYYDKFLELLEDIKFSDDDYMYVLGDVLDRGDKPITLLKYIMNKPNVELLMGNHEYTAYIILSMLMKEMDSEKTVESVLTQDFMDELNLWLYNGGGTTLKQFMSIFDRTEQHDILDYLSDLQLFTTVESNGKFYILAHTFGHNNFSQDKELDEYGIDDFLFDRVDYSIKYYDNDDIYIVTGHTPVQIVRGDMNCNDILYINNHIDVDCGIHFSKITYATKVLRLEG